MIGSQTGRKKAVAGQRLTGVVQSHKAGAEPVPAGLRQPWEDLSEWWGRLCHESVLQQRDLIGWWCEVAREGADIHSWNRKTGSLRQQLLAAALAAMENGVKLSLEQQRGIVALGEQALRPPDLISIDQAYTISATWWSRARGMALAWVMIPVASQARIAKAWADFCSLPDDGD